MSLRERTRQVWVSSRFNRISGDAKPAAAQMCSALQDLAFDFGKPCLPAVILGRCLLL
jgi:hypothetical protein